MQFEPIAVPAGVRDRTIARDLVLAVVLAMVLSLSWAVNDWARVGRLILPDADDMMRLAQVRDWLDGQRFNDWTQYRMAPPLGAPMHWSRINDFGIAAIILAATPLVGRHQGEIAAVVLYPASLFAVNLFLSARIGRRLWGQEAGWTTAVLAALAFPGIALFIPGRIDHHALQTVIVELAILAMLRRATAVNGAVAGVAVAVSLVVGLETAPQMAALTGVMCLFWAVRGLPERPRLAGFAAGLGGGTLFSLVTLRPSFWSPALCDAFTPASSTGTLAVAAALTLLALASPVLRDWKARVGVGLAAGAVAIGLTLHAYPACLDGPYAAMNPFLRHVFLPHIDEANSIFDQESPWRLLSLGGLLLTGCIGAVWMLARWPRRWPILLVPVAVIVASALVSLAQARGTYIGAPVAAPLLAGLILHARRRTTWRTPAVVGAWLVSAGVAWNLLPAIGLMIHGRPPDLAPKAPSVQCTSGDVWAQIDRYPRGTVMAPTNMASYLIGATHMATVGAGYHRNDRGNMAMYRYFLADPARGKAIARQWNVRYVAYCPGDFAEMGAATLYPHSLAAVLLAGRTPTGFQQIPLRGARLRFYRVDR